MRRQKLRERVGACASVLSVLFGIFAVMAYLDVLFGFETDPFFLRWTPAIAGVFYFTYWWADEPDRKRARRRDDDERRRLEKLAYGTDCQVPVPGRQNGSGRWATRVALGVRSALGAEQVLAVGVADQVREAAQVSAELIEVVAVQADEPTQRRFQGRPVRTEPGRRGMTAAAPAQQHR
jgi:hypothetical protein